MKKLLLTLTLLLTLGFAASAETYTYEWKISSSDKSETGKENISLTLNGVSWAGENLSNGDTPHSGRNGTTCIQFGSKANSLKQLTLQASAPFAGHKIESVTVTAWNGSSAKCSANVYVNDIQIGSTETLTTTTGASYNFASSEILDADKTLKIVFTNANTQNASGNLLNLAGIKVVYSDVNQEPEVPVITATSGETVYAAGEEAHEVEKGTEVTFSVTNCADDAIESEPSLTFENGKATVTITENADYIITAGEEIAEFHFTAVEPKPVAPTITVTAGGKSYTANANVEKGTEITINVENYTSIYALVGEAELTEADFENGSYTFTLEATTDIMVEAKNGEEVTSNLDITLTATEPVTTSSVTATYDFAKNNYGITPRNDNDYEQSAATMNELAVSLITEAGKYRIWQADNTLRFKKESKLTFSVPAGCSLTKITFSGKDMSLTPDCGTKESSSTGTNTTWIATPNSETTSVTFTQGTSKVGQILTATVEYETTLTEISSYSHELSYKATVASLNYKFSVVNHNDDAQYKVTLSFTNASDATVVSNETFTHEEDEVVVEATPARVASANKQFKGSIGVEGLSNSTEYNVKASYAVEGSTVAPTTIHLGTITTNTTGIEDVTVEGNEAAEYFNLQGVRVAQPQAGQIYIVRRGAKATKELVK